MQDETLMQLLAAHDEGIARKERLRIADRQVDAGECPPAYAKCCNDLSGSSLSCKKCWQDWLEADE